MRSQFFQDKFIFLFLCRLCTIYSFLKVQVSIESNQSLPLIGIKMAFTDRSYFVAYHTTAEVSALYINIGFRCNNMSKFRSDMCCNINSLCIRKIPQEGHTATIFDCFIKRYTINLHFRRPISTSTQIADNSSRHLAVIFI